MIVETAHHCGLTVRGIVWIEGQSVMYYTRRPDLKVQEVEGEVLVLDDQSGFIHQLNHAASFIWRQCNGETSVKDIARKLAREFELEDSVALKDVSEAIEKLLDLKLLVQ
jgi:hypothetical protein